MTRTGRTSEKHTLTTESQVENMALFTCQAHVAVRYGNLHWRGVDCWYTRPRTNRCRWLRDIRTGRISAADDFGRHLSVASPARSCDWHRSQGERVLGRLLACLVTPRMSLCGLLGWRWRWVRTGDVSHG